MGGSGTHIILFLLCHKIATNLPLYTVLGPSKRALSNDTDVAFLQLDEALVEQQRQAYAVEGVDESEAAGPPKKKRKQEYENGQEVRRIALSELRFS